MERTERLAAHVEEAFRLAGMRDVASHRVALLLFDSAAELLLFRDVEDRLGSSNLYERILTRIAEIEQQEGYLPDELAETKAHALSQTVSKSKRRALDRDFNEKARYLTALGRLSEVQKRVLMKLHAYRNEAYHNDRVRPLTLSSAVDIYAFVVCELMRLLPPSWESSVLGVSYPRSEKYASHGGLGLQLQTTIANVLSADLSVSKLSMNLSAHVLDRLDQIDEDLQESGRYMSREQEWTPDAVLHLVQLADKDVEAPVTPGQCLAKRVLVTRKTLESWRRRAENLALTQDPQQAFGAFADLEDEIEPVESQIEELVVAIDTEVQRAIDYLRGK